MRRHFKEKAAENLFVIIDKNERYKLVDYLSGAKTFFLSVGFPPQYVQKALDRYKTYRSTDLFEIGININPPDGLPQLYLRPNSGTEHAHSDKESLTYPESLSVKEGLEIIKKAYSLYNNGALFFDMKMLAKENLNSDEDDDNE